MVGCATPSCSRSSRTAVSAPRSCADSVPKSHRVALRAAGRPGMVTDRNSMDNKELISVAGNVLLGNYRSAPLVFKEGKGVRLIDADGNRYLDLVAGIAVISVGHAHPELVKAISEQAAKLMHVSNLFFND